MISLVKDVNSSRYKFKGRQQHITIVGMNGHYKCYSVINDGLRQPLYSSSR